MKKFLSIALLLSGICFLSNAQESPKKERHSLRMKSKREIIQKSPEEIAKFQTERMTKELSLTESQRKEIYALQLRNANKRNEAVELAKKNREMQRADRLVFKDEMNKILTPEQQKLLSENRTKRLNSNKKQMHESRKMNKRDSSRFQQRKSKSTLKNTSND